MRTLILCLCFLPLAGCGIKHDETPTVNTERKSCCTFREIIQHMRQVNISHPVKCWVLLVRMVISLGIGRILDGFQLRLFRIVSDVFDISIGVLRWH